MNLDEDHLILHEIDFKSIQNLLEYYYDSMKYKY